MDLSGHSEGPTPAIRLHNRPSRIIATASSSTRPVSCHLVCNPDHIEQPTGFSCPWSTSSDQQRRSPSRSKHPRGGSVRLRVSDFHQQEWDCSVSSGSRPAQNDGSPRSIGFFSDSDLGIVARIRMSRIALESDLEATPILSAITATNAAAITVPRHRTTPGTLDLRLQESHTVCVFAATQDTNANRPPSLATGAAACRLISLPPPPPPCGGWWVLAGAPDAEDRVQTSRRRRQCSGRM